MTATTGYQASPESNDALISYAIESAWGVDPATAFQAIRFNSETLAGSKSRARPNEINPTGEASSNVTQSESAAGAINVAMSYGTHDDFRSIVLGAEWEAPIAVAGISGDIALANVDSTSCTLISTLDDKFIDFATVGQWIRLLGFTNAGNNKIMRVKTVVSTKSLVLTTPFALSVTETPSGTAAKVRASMLRNGAEFRSMTLQKMLSSTMYMRYPGLFVTGWTFSAALGQFVTESFTCLAQSESKATSDMSTGDVLAAPTGRVHDTVGGIGGVLINDVLIDAVVDTISFHVTRAGAAGQYGIGSASAQGMTRGTLEAAGSLVVYFKDFTEYDRFKSETQISVSLVTEDSSGNAYVITYRSAAIMNPNAVVGGPNQPIKATFALEGNPASGGGTIQIDRLPSS